MHNQKNYHYVLLEFWNCPCNTNFLFLFLLAYKPTTFAPAVMTKPLFMQNVLGLILVLCIVFIADLFPWFYGERFQSNSVLDY